MKVTVTIELERLHRIDDHIKILEQIVEKHKLGQLEWMIMNDTIGIMRGIQEGLK